MANKVSLRAAIRYVNSPRLPIWIGDPGSEILRELSVARAQGGTVFKVTPEQWISVLNLIGGWPVKEVNKLERYEDYSREMVHDLFSPETRFTSQRGTWGLQGIVTIPNRPGDYVFFVTLGKKQGEHKFDEGITVDGVLSWQSQPRESLNSERIKQLIDHDELQNSIYLFLRTKEDIPYTYLGNLKYLSHDKEREYPVYFQWQIQEWDPEKVPERVNLELQEIAKADITVEQQKSDFLELVRTPNKLKREGTNTHTFRAKKNVDYAERDAITKNWAYLVKIS